MRLLKRKKIDACFERGSTQVWVEVSLSNIEDPLYVFYGNEDPGLARLGERELKTVITILERHTKKMKRQKNFPPVYEELLKNICAYRDELKSEKEIEVQK